MSAVAFLPSYFAKLDAGEDIVELLAPDFTFSFLWATDDGAQEFAGALDDFLGYMGQRDPAGQRHHISHALREGNVELVSGSTTRHGSPLGTFLFAVEAPTTTGGLAGSMPRGPNRSAESRFDRRPPGPRRRRHGRGQWGSASRSASVLRPRAWAS